jgi:hypothetical protein
MYMITNFGRTLVVLLIFVCSAFASRINYTYGNRTYKQPEPALAAEQAEIDSMVSKIPPTDHAIGGSANVIIPSVSTIIRTLVIWKGKPPNKEQKEKGDRFTATSLINAYRGRGEEIRKRRIFDRLVITESDSPENAAFSEDTAILLIVKDGKPGWFVKKGESKSPAPTEIEEVSTAIPPVQREILWLDRIEKALRGD